MPDKLTYDVATTTNEVFRKWNARPFTADMEMLIAVCGEAVRAGLFYNKDVDAFVGTRYVFNPAQQAYGQGKVEGGCIGYETYYARHEYEARQHRAICSALVRTMNLHPGRQLKTVKRHETYKRCVVVDVTDPTRILMDGTRGNRRYRLTLSAVAIAEGMMQEKTHA